MAKVSEKTLLEKGKPDGVKSLVDVVTLNLSSMQIKDIDASLFNQLSKLEDLDLSKNRILSFPSGVILPVLKKLDLSDNTISQLKFLKNFSNLETLLLTPNPLQENDKYLAVYLLPKLKELESINISETRAKIASLETEIAVEIGATWAQHFQEAYEAEENLIDGDIDVMYANFIKIMKKQRIVAKGDEKYSKIHDEMLETKSTEYFSRFRTDAEIVDRKKRRLEKEKKNGTDAAKNGAVKNGGPKDKKLVNAGLPTCSDYEPVHFLRCHSFNNDPADSKTKIWRCAFQPSFKPSTDPAAASNGANGDARLSDSRLITTCGGDSICLIDCSSGKVMKKYKHAKEDFYCVAWSTLQVMQADGEKRGETTNIIAAAGQQGDIKLLQPDQLLCIALLKGHKKHVNCLLFHTSNPCYLFSGSNDKSVMLWDIGVPVLPDFKTRWKALINFKVPVTGPCDVLNLHLHQEKYIMAATEAHLVVWDATAEDANGPHRKSVGGKAGGKAAKGPKSKKHLLEIEVPSKHTIHTVVDGLVGVNHSLVATKYVQDGLISLWNLNEAITSNEGRPVVSVDSITQLKWSSTDQLYINLNASSDGTMLLAGDDAGGIWLYNLSEFAPWGGSVSPDPDSLYQPSRIIEWPEIHIKSNDMGDLADPAARKVIINHLAISDDRLYIIACTDNNIVCIWKQCTDE